MEARPGGPLPLPDLSVEAAPSRAEAVGDSERSGGGPTTPVPDDALHLEELAARVEPELVRRPPRRPAAPGPATYGTRGGVRGAEGVRTGTGPVATFAAAAQDARE